MQLPFESLECIHADLFIPHSDFYTIPHLAFLIFFFPIFFFVFCFLNALFLWLWWVVFLWLYCACLLFALLCVLWFFNVITNPTQIDSTRLDSIEFDAIQWSNSIDLDVRPTLHYPQPFQGCIEDLHLQPTQHSYTFDFIAATHADTNCAFSFTQYVRQSFTLTSHIAIFNWVEWMLTEQTPQQPLTVSLFRSHIEFLLF